MLTRSNLILSLDIPMVRRECDAVIMYARCEANKTRENPSSESCVCRGYYAVRNKMNMQMRKPIKSLWDVIGNLTLGRTQFPVFVNPYCSLGVYTECLIHRAMMTPKPFAER